MARLKVYNGSTWDYVSNPDSTVVNTTGAQVLLNKVVTNVSASAPANPIDGMLWWDTDDVANSSGNFYNPYKMDAYRSTNQSIGATAGVDTIIFTTEAFDTNSNYDTSTGAYTCPVSGYYLAMAHLRFDSSAATYIQLYLGGQKCSDSATSNGQQRNINGTIFAYYAAGATISVGLYHDNAGSIIGSATECRFSVTLMSI